jgi:Uma2 family endonuclease
MSLTIKDLEKLQTQLCEVHLDYQLELIDGKIIVMDPSDIVSSQIGAELIRLLANWIKPRKLGRVFDSSGGFILPNSDLTAPDVSFVSAERLRRSPRYFVKSQSERIKPLKEKIQSFLSMGARVGILVDPDKHTVTIYRTDSDPIVLTDGDVLTIPEFFPGWEVKISELWPVEFE